MAPADFCKLKKIHLLLGISESILSACTPYLISWMFADLFEYELHVRIVATEDATYFLPPEMYTYSDKDEYDVIGKKTNIDKNLIDWADILLIAPLGPFTLENIVSKKSDANLLVKIATNWPFNKPKMFCPGMPNDIWKQPSTEKNVRIMKKRGFRWVVCPNPLFLVSVDMKLKTIADYVKNFILNNIHRF